MLTLSRPLLTLDPLKDTHQEGAHLRTVGPLIPVNLPGPVATWIATGSETARAVLDRHPDLSKDPQHWSAYQRGDIPRGWYLLPLVTARTVINAHGENHRRLRALTARAFAASRVEKWRPRVREIIAALLDRLAALPPGPLNLKEAFAFPLPMLVICEMFGVEDEEQRSTLRKYFETMLSSQSSAEEAEAADAGSRTLLQALIDHKRKHPGDDLTSDLIAAHDGDRLTAQELVEALILFLVAGHETSVNLLINAIRALYAHPDQLRLVLNDPAYSWKDAVEAALGYDGPVRGIFFYFAVRDTRIEGVTVREGEPIMVALAAANRDTTTDPTADQFLITPGASPHHIGFGHGAHFCIGAPLARIEVTEALAAFFERYPEARPAVPDDQLTPIASPAINGVATYLIWLTPPPGHTPAPHTAA